MSRLSRPGEFQAFAGVLLAAVRSLSIYPAGHPSVRDALEQLLVRLRGLLQDVERVRLAVVGQEIVVEQRQMPVAGGLTSRLVEQLTKCGVGKLLIFRGVTADELQIFVRLLAAGGGGDGQSVGEQLRSSGVRHIEATTLSIDEADDIAHAPAADAWSLYQRAVTTLAALNEHAQAKGRLDDLNQVRHVAEAMVDVSASAPNTLLLLHSLKKHDEYSLTHSINVAVLTLAMGRAIGFNDETLRQLTFAALLHDIGKVRVDGGVLRKPGKLDAAELLEMQRHSAEGTKVLLRSGLGELANIVAYEHQLAYETDHPDYKRWPLHIASQLICIADVYDALRSKRPYRGELQPDEALAIMHREAAKKFDPDLLGGFTRMIGFYPSGTCVRLSNGSLALSVAASPSDPRAPRVLIVRDADGRPVEPPALFDLSTPNPPEGWALSVSEVVDPSDYDIDLLEYL